MVTKKFQDLTLPALGMGTMRLPVCDGDDSQIDEAKTAEMVAYAMEHGINYFDTAWGYHSGSSELVMGRVLSAYPREKFYLATKFPGYDLSNMDKVEEIFEKQLEKIREIRISERRFYQKITDIYATALDYDPAAPTTKRFFAAVQNKMHFSVHGQTAAEVIYHRADAEKDHMGLTSWDGSPQGKIHKYDVTVAKNYLTEYELAQLERIVTAYLDIAELQAIRHIPMTMQDWEERLNGFLRLMDREILMDAGKVSAELAKAHAESEFEKYRIVQDRLYESDFDRFMALEGKTKSFQTEGG